jgi:hypothetical protein
MISVEANPNINANCPDTAFQIKENRNVRFDKTAEVLSEISFFKQFKDYGQCYEVLGGMVKLRCGKACREGGGNPFCKIRKCCQKKEIQGCWLCDEFETCKTLDDLKANHGIAHIKEPKHFLTEKNTGTLNQSNEAENPVISQVSQVLIQLAISNISLFSQTYGRKTGILHPFC